MSRGFNSGTWAVLHFTGRGYEIEIERRIPFKTGDGMAHIARDRFIGAALGFGDVGGGTFTRVEGQRRVTTIAAGFDPGHHRVLFRVAVPRQFEVFDFIPMMRVRLRHHRLAPLLVEIGS